MSKELHYRLVPQFRFQHAPIASGGSIGVRQTEAMLFSKRLQYSTGGAHLITGYRGVGKTTFVFCATDALRQSLAEHEKERLVHVYLPISRQTSSTELMHHLVRGLYNELHDAKLLSRLPKALVRDLELAYTRTSAALSVRSSVEREISAGIADIGIFGKTAGNSSFKRRSNQAQDIDYLAYDDRAAESDLMKIGDALSSVRLKRFQLPIPFGRAQSIRPIIILDELDKLDNTSDAPDEQLPNIDELLKSLKTLFTSSRMTFIFVAGRDLYDRWLSDVSRGDSILESVFCSVTYVSGVWNSVVDLCNPFLAELPSDQQKADSLRRFQGYLAYMGRGMPRRILREFNDHVSWNDGLPVLRLQEQRRYQFYSDLYEFVRLAEESILGDDARSLRADLQDRQRLSLFHLCDWIWDRGRLAFDLSELSSAASALNKRIIPESHLINRLVIGLVEALNSGEYLEPAEGTLLARTKSDAPARYRVPQRRLIEMGRFSETFTNSKSKDFPDLGSRYKPIEFIGSGGLSEVYEVLDTITGTRLAAKVERPEISNLDVDFLKNEAQILHTLAGTMAVSLHDAKLDYTPRFLILDYLDGYQLSDIVANSTNQGVLFSVVSQLISAVKQIHERGVIWNDAKLNNVKITTEGKVKLIDFGTSTLKNESQEEKFGSVIGTPPYIAPEIGDGKNATFASDTYSLCICLYQLYNDRLHIPKNLDLENFPEIPDCPKLASLIKRGLSPAPDARPSLQEFIQVLPKSTNHDHADLASLLMQADEAGARPIAQTKYVTQGIESRSDASRVIGAFAEISHQTIDRPLLRIGDAKEDATILFYPLRDCKKVTIGRSQENDVVLSGPEISRFHAEVREVDRDYYLHDLNSENNVYINNAVVLSEGQKLTNGDHITIGKTNLTFHQ